MNKDKYRPLIKVSTIHNEEFLPFDYAYNPAEISKIKKYLPKSLSLFGTDCSNFVEEDKVQCDKEKLKLKAIEGKQINSNKLLKFCELNSLQMISWDNLYLCLNIPFNPRQDAEESKDELDSKLFKYIETCLHFRNKQTGECYNKQSKIDLLLSDIDLFFQPSQINPEAFDTQFRQIRFLVPVSIILSKKPFYSPHQIYRAVEEDIIASIKIMIKNKLCIRIIRSVIAQNKILILQSFINKESERQIQTKKLDFFINKSVQIKSVNAVVETEIQEIQKTTEQQLMNCQTDRRDLSNKSLMLILIGMFFIYLFLKVNPLQKWLNQGL